MDILRETTFLSPAMVFIARVGLYRPRTLRTTNLIFGYLVTRETWISSLPESQAADRLYTAGIRSDGGIIPESQGYLDRAA